MQPFVLGPNQPRDRFYRGGALIADFRGTEATGDHVPEDWVASTTSMAGHSTLGLTTLPDGRLLVDAVAADPEGWLGPGHVSAYGADTRLLVKLLHAGQRLPVHAHPDREFASRWLGRAHGKVEAWHILTGGDIYLGVRADVDLADVAALVDSQDTDGLLALLRRRRVERGDTVYVPAGMLHAIGEGILLAELQEPEDLSILLEWRGFDLDGAADGHLGVGFDRALTAVDLRPVSEEALDALITSDAWGSCTLPPAAAEYFRLERHRVTADLFEIALDQGFAIVLVTDGAITLATNDGEKILAVGGTVVVPWDAGAMTISGSGEVLVARPPAPPS
ncbi:class I mannose-6-phosphate isomerase [uncultured Schumannella sp.]|uniref:class I mannose-6-phosphate isomerase n=1 Tax=uncultured Schumannella sp. TaxID=1195956 RepID=UPI0025F7ADEE|nr:class I mannose-6-phosphate isomerase [uncultured Schumannella sp.]